MKLTLKPLLAALALVAVASGPAHAGAFAVSDLNISDIFLAVPDGSGGFIKITNQATITLTGEGRTGTADSNYNGAPGVGGGNGSINGTTGTVDVLARCAGPSCGAAVNALYGGSIENNLTTHLSPPPSANYALGDMLISGSALSGAGINGLTRANAAATGPDNSGGSNATILNTASITATFSVGTTITAAVGATGDSWLYAWVNTVAGELASAGAGQGFSVTVKCTNSVTNLCGGFTTLAFLPDEFNPGGTTSTFADNVNTSFTGSVYSDLRTYNAGTRYALTINQSSNATVSSVPEPESLALAGLALLGLGLTSRKRLSVKRSA